MTFHKEKTILVNDIINVDTKIVLQWSDLKGHSGFY